MTDEFAIMVTGPRKLNGHYRGTPVHAWVRGQLQLAVTNAIGRHYGLVGMGGMAIGIDQMFTEVCLEFDIPFVAYVPFVGQERLWPFVVQDHYRWLLDQCQHVEVVCEGGYAPWKMQRRNEVMVDLADAHIAVWDGILGGGGTANCVRYIRSKNLPFFHINYATKTSRWSK